MNAPVDVLADYIVPVSIDHAGRYPSKRPGNVWFEAVNGRRFRMELVGNPYGLRAGYDPAGGATVLCDCHVREVGDLDANTQDYSTETGLSPDRIRYAANLLRCKGGAA